MKVTVNVDLRGTISNAICPDNEIIIGFLAIPGKEVTWEELDQQIFTLFEVRALHFLAIAAVKSLGILSGLHSANRSGSSSWSALHRKRDWLSDG